MTKRSRVSQQDIAAKAGVSVMTVSLALRGSPRLSAATRERITGLAAEMGYERDPALSALVAYRHETAPAENRATVAILTNGESPDQWPAADSAKQVLAGIREAAQAQGYQVEIVWVGDSSVDPQVVMRPLVYRQVSGLILAPTPIDRPYGDLGLSNFPVVAVETQPDLPRVYFVSPNHFTAVAAAWRGLEASGHRRIGLVLSVEAVERVRHRWDAAHYIEQQRLPEAARIPTLLLGSGDEAASDDDLVRDWLARHRPDAVLGKAYGILERIRKAGWRVPDDVAYASLNIDDEPRGVAGIDQNRRAIGRQAMDTLHSLILRNRRGLQDEVIGSVVNGFWRDGDTVRMRR